MLIYEVLKVLLLYLKWFKYIEVFGRYVKLNYCVVFFFELKIFNLIDEVENFDVSYKFFVVVVYIGFGFNYGYYVCFVKNNYCWFLYDDDCVEVVDEE